MMNEENPPLKPEKIRGLVSNLLIVKNHRRWYGYASHDDEEGLIHLRMPFIEFREWSNQVGGGIYQIIRIYQSDFLREYDEFAVKSFEGGDEETFINHMRYKNSFTMSDYRPVEFEWVLHPEIKDDKEILYTRFDTMNESYFAQIERDVVGLVNLSAWFKHSNNVVLTKLDRVKFGDNDSWLCSDIEVAKEAAFWKLRQLQGSDWLVEEKAPEYFKKLEGYKSE